MLPRGGELTLQSQAKPYIHDKRSGESFLAVSNPRKTSTRAQHGSQNRQEALRESPRLLAEHFLTMLELSLDKVFDMCPTIPRLICFAHG